MNAALTFGVGAITGAFLLMLLNQKREDKYKCDWCGRPRHEGEHASCK